ncbi:hypothetical protein ABKN59_001724 [Abortiporus biennis]
MGQYWTIVNIDKRQNLGGMGKLVESLPYYGFRELANHLRRFEAAGVKDPKVEVRVRPTPEPSLKNKAGRKRGISFEETRMSLSRPLPRSTLGNFKRVPNELIFEILRQLEDYIDVISFSFTNTNIYFLGYKVLQRRYLDDAADWEGDRIICLGDYAKWNALPKGSFTKSELEKICLDYEIEYQPTLPSSNDATDTGYNTADDDETIPDALVAALQTEWRNPYEYVEECFPRPRSEYGLSEMTVEKQVSKRLKLNLGWFTTTYTNLATLLKPDFTEYKYCAEIPPLICNLSKRVYINVLEIKKMQGENLSWIEVMGSRICWSANPRASTAPADDDLCAGSWAGDRFARRRLDQLHELGGEGEWKDVTEHEMERIRKIWIYYFGEEKWQRKSEE